MSYILFCTTCFGLLAIIRCCCGHTHTQRKQSKHMEHKNSTQRAEDGTLNVYNSKFKRYKKRKVQQSPNRSST
jgi:hypothetical protein